MDNTLAGTWHSRYGYVQGPNSEPQTSDHRVQFTQKNGIWIGASLPNNEGSELAIVVRQNGNEFTGEWRERTSASGHYKGREFTGVILLVLQPDGRDLKGMWLGVSSSSGGVKSGVWLLRRES